MEKSTVASGFSTKNLIGALEVKGDRLQLFEYKVNGESHSFQSGLIGLIPIVNTRFTYSGMEF